MRPHVEPSLILVIILIIVVLDSVAHILNQRVILGIVDLVELLVLETFVKFEVDVLIDVIPLSFCGEVDVVVVLVVARGVLVFVRGLNWVIRVGFVWWVIE